MNKVTLEKLLYRLSVAISDVEITHRYDNYTDLLIIEINKHFESIKGEYVLVPLTWWDAFKLKYFPNYLLNQFPVNYRSIETRMVFPNLKSFSDLRQSSCIMDQRTFDLLRNAAREVNQ
jgi:glutaredoxin-related protein